MIRYDLMEEFMYGMQWLWMGIEEVEGMYKDFVKEVGEDEELFKEIVQDMKKHVELKERLESQIKDTNEGYKVMELLEGSTAENLIDNSFTREDRDRLFKRASKKIELKDIIGVLKVREEVEEVKSKIIKARVNRMIGGNGLEEEEEDVKMEENKELVEVVKEGIVEMENLGDKVDEETYRYEEQVEEERKEGSEDWVRKNREVREVAQEILLDQLRVRRYVEGKGNNKKLTSGTWNFLNKLTKEEYIEKEGDVDKVAKEIIKELDEDIIEKIISIGKRMRGFSNKVNIRVENSYLMDEVEEEII